jgi:predicted aldo/keto reductase-like oxidoreductase
MEYTIFGRTGRKVSRLGFGGAVAGIKDYLRAHDPGSRDDRQAVLEAIHTALDNGINFFDTAPVYGDGLSEEIFGIGLQGVPAEKVFIATKINSWGEVDVRRSVEQSLLRLKRERLDLVQIHGTTYAPELAKRLLQKKGMAEQLVRLKEEGLISNVGFTSEDQNEAVYQMLRSGYFDTVQLCYNFIFQHPYDASRKCGTIYAAEQQGMGIITMRAATSMIFQKWIRQVNPENTFDYTPALIQFPLSNPLVDVVLVGMSNKKRVLENIAICDDLSARVDIDALHNTIV